MHLPELGLEDGLGNKKNIGRLEQSFWSNLWLAKICPVQCRPLRKMD